MKALLTILGILLLLAGLLFAGQGAGLIMWPASSFMLAQGQWVLYGLVIAAVGAALLLAGRRRR